MAGLLSRQLKGMGGAFTDVLQIPAQPLRRPCLFQDAAGQEPRRAIHQPGIRSVVFVNQIADDLFGDILDRDDADVLAVGIGGDGHHDAVSLNRK